MGLFSLSSHAALTNDKTSSAPYATTFKITAGSKMEKKKSICGHWNLIYMSVTRCVLLQDSFSVSLVTLPESRKDGLHPQYVNFILGHTIKPFLSHKMQK